MYIVVRTWANAGELVDAMQQREQEVIDIISGVPGFVAYYATRAGDTLTMYVNGQKVHELHDPDLKAGTINLEAGSWKEGTSATTFAFDNFTITRPR